MAGVGFYSKNFRRGIRKEMTGLSLFETFKTHTQFQEETALIRTYRVPAKGKEYKVIITKRRANGHTVIHCENNRIAWEQVPRFPRFTGRNYGEKVPLYTAIPEKGCVTVFVVRGRPDGFVGLDEGVFRCADNFDERCINVMSYRRFKRL